MHELLCFYVPCPDEQIAQKLIAQLIEARLIACGNVFPAKSSYIWENAFTTEAEFIIFMKTLPTKEEALENKILELHPYEVPCIARWKVSCNHSYFMWVANAINDSSEEIDES
ncbi:MAG TPA: divalent-cation tolerance protein CutA [Saprospiraceae bacterium]|nr:divalent-cation tolerance protein CutA [Saprospiraceae bacterium]HOY12611.1 divalent-cation tolerance protein CutA [Saprospiraceae bacterium]HPN71409.1 divalent-cation tolerance protein CutA [Saprospiraceae bacterium]